MIMKGIWYPEIAETTQGSFVTTCQFSTKNYSRPAMGKWSASTEERPKLPKSLRWPIHIINPVDKTKLPKNNLYLTGLPLLLETLGWN